MKKLQLNETITSEDKDFIVKNLRISKTKSEFIELSKRELENLTIVFYDHIGLILKHIGFINPSISREGDVNCRMDAIIIDEENSIPIEIKSPREVREINIKSIRQAFENKVIILSRKFYNATYDTTSLSIGFSYPPERSDIYELIVDIKQAFGFNIGIINIDDLLSIVYDVKVNQKQLNFYYFNTFMGRFNYEEAFNK